MPNPLRCETSFEAEGKTYELRYDWNRAVEFEEESGRPISDLVMDTMNVRVSAKFVRALLWAGLREKHPKCTLTEAGRLMAVIGREETTRLTMEVMRYFFPEAEEGDPPDPPEPASE